MSEDSNIEYMPVAKFIERLDLEQVAKTPKYLVSRWKQLKKYYNFFDTTDHYNTAYSPRISATLTDAFTPPKSLKLPKKYQLFTE